MKRVHGLWALVSLIAMQCIGQGVVWESVWDSGLGDARIMSALWWAWTIAQVVLAVPVGIGLARIGFRWTHAWASVEGIDSPGRASDQHVANAPDSSSRSGTFAA